MTASPIRILLSANTSEVLTAAGEGAFAIVHKAEHPDTGRWLVTLAPIDWQRAVDASNILLGTHRAVRIKAPTSTASTATTQIQ